MNDFPHCICFPGTYECQKGMRIYFVVISCPAKIRWVQVTRQWMRSVHLPEMSLTQNGVLNRSMLILGDNLIARFGKTGDTWWHGPQYNKHGGI